MCIRDSYCKTNFCLRRYILTYFGEKAPMRCGGCSNCRTDLRQPEVAAPAKRPVSTRAAEVTDADIPADLMERLQKLRSHLARRASVPAYVIFSNQTLREMCAKQPRDEYEMLRVSGVGELKMKKYGRAFLDAIDDWRSEQSGC